MQHGVTWKFNVPRAPWWGGFFDSMVRSVKPCLTKMLGTARVDYEEFETTLVEVEGILNSWPLTYATEDIKEPLTPSLLCIGCRLLSPTRNPGTGEFGDIVKVPKVPGHGFETLLESLAQGIPHGALRTPSW